MKKLVALVLFFVIALTYVASSQTSLSESQQKKILRQARNYLYAAEYTEAFPLYSELYKADSNNSIYNYELGICIYEGSRDKLKSKKYFEKIVELDEREEKPELFYYLGRLYHLEHNFLFATAAYSTYIAEGLPPGKVGTEMEAEVEAYILQCEDGKDLLELNSHILESVQKKSKDVTKFDIDSNHYLTLENLGEEINSSFDEHSPLIIDNREVLLFTSRRNGSTGGELFSDGQYYEDIYMANFRNGIWAEVNNVNNSDYFNGAYQNSADHNSTVSISEDENELFIYSNNHIDVLNRKDGTWLPLEKFSQNFNRAGVQISSVTISPDLKSLYIDAERYDSYGGRDLYRATLQDDGSWGEMQHLGPKINTEFDEVSPFLLNDTVLYFSSKGHSSIGGWDVFVTHKTDTGWTVPENLGIPVNTPYDEVNYMIDHEGDKAYYCSSREGGYGGFDIYTITTTVQREIDEEDFKKLEQGDTTEERILVVDNVEVDENGKLTPATLAALNDAQKQLAANPNLKVEIKASAPGKNGHDIAKKNAELAMGVLVSAGISKDRISLTYQSSDTIASSGPLKANYEETIYFGSASKYVTEWSQEKKMKPLLEYLKGNTTGTIYLSGHTDHVGDTEYNLTLSRERTDSVEKFLRDNGITNKIRKEYFGEASPRYTIEEVTTDPKQLIYNRRVKIVVF
ncbi:MAG: hypothetical protein CL840_14660 [Crocinitomicaceae bacterium]|nr:hypothetical protein [Crocinitomicaceae bacterium]|tara:strand:+ start:8655 stop:10709 length:2055 start_codon:yes stop_codon:yes gene_type:complete